MNKILKYGILFLCFLAVVLVIKGLLGLSIGKTYSKYTDKGVYEHFLKTKKVYFESDRLNNDYTVINNYNYENVIFNIFNGNGSLISNTSADYEISCTTDNDDYDCIIDDDDDSITGTFSDLKGCYNNGEVVDLTNSECATNNYTWDYIINNVQHSVKLVNNGDNLSDKVTATVNFSTTSGYSYELEGNFVFNITNNADRDAITYEVYNDIGNLCILKINNLYTEDKTVNIRLRNEYKFDNTVFNSYDININTTSGYIKNIDLDIDAESIVYLSLYSTNGVCSKSNVTVSDSSGGSGSSLPAIKANFAAYTWSEIYALVHAVTTEELTFEDLEDTYNLAVGQEKTIDLGSSLGTHTVRIANMSNGESNTCGTTGFSETACGFVVEFKDIIYNYSMNSTQTSVGGWGVSGMCGYVNTTIYNAITAVTGNIISDTIAVSGHERYATSNYTSTDKIYLLSAHEVYGYVDLFDTANDSTRQLDYYKNNNVTESNYSGAIKKRGNTATGWWLRTALPAYTHMFLYVDTDGDLFFDSAHYSRGVSPAFRIT